MQCIILGNRIRLLLLSASLRKLPQNNIVHLLATIFIKLQYSKRYRETIGTTDSLIHFFLCTLNSKHLVLLLVFPFNFFSTRSVLFLNPFLCFCAEDYEALRVECPLILLLLPEASPCNIQEQWHRTIFHSFPSNW